MSLQLSDHDLLERIEELMNHEFIVRMTYDIVPNEIKYTFWKIGETVLYEGDRLVQCSNRPKYTAAVDLCDPLARDPWHIANEVLKLENEEMRALKALSDPPKPAEYIPIRCKVCGAPMTHGQYKCIYCGQEYLKVERN